MANTPNPSYILDGEQLRGFPVSYALDDNQGLGHPLDVVLMERQARFQSLSFDPVATSLNGVRKTIGYYPEGRWQKHPAWVAGLEFEREGEKLAVLIPSIGKNAGEREQVKIYSTGRITPKSMDKLLEEVAAETIKIGYVLSPSSIKGKDDCQRCFWLKHNEGIQPGEGIFVSIANGIDLKLKASFDRYRKRGRLPPPLNSLREEGVKLYRGQELQRWMSNSSGVQYNDGEGNILRGAVDEVLVLPDGKLIVLDYKTRGFALKPDTAASNQTQLNIYNFLLRKEGQETADYAYLLFYIPGEINRAGNITFDKPLVKVTITPENGLNEFQRAISILKSSTVPDSDPKCKDCNSRRRVRDLEDKLVELRN